ncbi:hypothetical protein [Woeseia oceani]|uniref:Uncharacterized protein n=1 Tax=Woeseia oceani TaxID=1548547 RepID=A0A193LFF5_9GAMM|nr:hypothetical protein [Woeseia oceani]ANO51265.1 hypothetical protein BA177_08675 [Woeseia oceani]
MLNHRVVSRIVAIGFGLLLAMYSYQRITDPLPKEQRRQEEQVVMAAREILLSYVGRERTVDLVDPVAPDRKVGKVYIYPTDDGWQVSGHYRRDNEMRWHPWLMTLNKQHGLIALDVQDSSPDLVSIAAVDPVFTTK